MRDATGSIKDVTSAEDKIGAHQRLEVAHSPPWRCVDAKSRTQMGAPGAESIYTSQCTMISLSALRNVAGARCDIHSVGEHRCAGLMSHVRACIAIVACLFNSASSSKINHSCVFLSVVCTFCHLLSSLCCIFCHHCARYLIHECCTFCHHCARCVILFDGNILFIFLSQLCHHRP